MQPDPDYRSLTTDQLIARLQIAASENKQLREANGNLHKMLEALREQGWATPRENKFHVNVRDYPMDHGHPTGDRTDLARKLAEANERADHWRQKYINLLDSTGRTR